MRLTAACALLFLVVAAEEKDRSPLRVRLEAALKKAAAEEPGRELLVVLLEDPRSGADTWRTLGAIRDELALVMESHGYRTTISPKVEAHLAAAGHNGTVRRERKPVDLQELQEIVEIDCLLLGVYFHKGRTRHLQLSCLDVPAKKELWKKAIRLTEKELQLSDHIPELNEKVVEYALSQKGKTVGNGQCWTLAAEALKQAGARRSGAYGFGKQLGPRDAILPGDVLQFEEASFRAPSAASMPHHTAIVAEVLGPETLKIVHQNFGRAGKTVSLLTIDLQGLVSGSVTIYRPRGSSDS